jgi:cytosine/adenosine deaminase-related metal-dependent hydrolase
MENTTFFAGVYQYICGMAYRKFSAGILFTGQDGLQNGEVLITDEKGRVEAVVDRADAGEDIQEVTGILSPGFVNAHCHLELSHMRGVVPEHTGLVDFLLAVITRRGAEEGHILQAIADAEAEMYRNGIVAVGDICNTAHTLPQKSKGNLQYYNFIETLGWNPAAAAASFSRAKAVYDLFLEQFGADRVALSPHAPYTVSEPLWALLQEHFGDKTITLHNQETPAEDELFRLNQGAFLRLYAALGIDHGHFVPPGTTSLQASRRHLQPAGQVLLVHNTCTTAADIAGLREQALLQKTFFCLCPNANLYIENALPPVALLRENDCTMVVGTDSLSSNHALSIAGELHTLHRHFPALERQELLQWATLNGAKALQLDDTLGSFEPGKMPGIVQVSEDFGQVTRLL